MNKIFFENKYILFGNENSENLPEIDKIDDSFLKTFTSKNNTESYFYKSDKDNILNELQVYVNHIKAAGGIVFSPGKSKIILIKHYNVWDLPKGWIENGETPENAAVREVSEETGIPTPSILAKLDETFHFYFFKDDDKINLKHTFWFKMISDKEYELKPQKEEDISEARWVKLEETELLKENMYPSVSLLLKLL